MAVAVFSSSVFIDVDSAGTAVRHDSFLTIDIIHCFHGLQFFQNAVPVSFFFEACEREEFLTASCYPAFKLTVIEPSHLLTIFLKKKIALGEFAQHVFMANKFRISARGYRFFVVCLLSARSSLGRQHSLSTSAGQGLSCRLALSGRHRFLL